MWDACSSSSDYQLCKVQRVTVYDHEACFGHVQSTNGQLKTPPGSDSVSVPLSLFQLGLSPSRLLGPAADHYCATDHSKCSLKQSNSQQSVHKTFRAMKLVIVTLLISLRTASYPQPR